MTKDEALHLALEAMKIKQQVTMWANDGDRAKFNKAIKAVEAALEAKDEPDQYAMDIECTKCGAKQSGVLTVHTTPPQRKPLTDEEMQRIIHEHTKLNPNQRDDKQLIGYIINATRAIEAAHGIKGEA
jgi:hypothetical protein